LRHSPRSSRPWMRSRRFLRLGRHGLQRRRERTGVEHWRGRRHVAACGHCRVNGQCLRHISVQGEAHRKIVRRTDLHGAGGVARLSKGGPRLRAGRARLNQQQCGCRLRLERVKAGHGNGAARRQSEATDHNREGSVTDQLNAHDRIQGPDSASNCPHGNTCALEEESPSLGKAVCSRTQYYPLLVRASDSLAR
jgi:hypothetical protein